MTDLGSTFVKADLRSCISWGFTYSHSKGSFWVILGISGFGLCKRGFCFWVKELFSSFSYFSFFSHFSCLPYFPCASCLFGFQPLPLPILHLSTTWTNSSYSSSRRCISLYFRWMIGSTNFDFWGSMLLKEVSMWNMFPQSLWTSSKCLGILVG